MLQNHLPAHLLPEIQPLKGSSNAGSRQWGRIIPGFEGCARDCLKILKRIFPIRDLMNWSISSYETRNSATPGVKERDRECGFILSGPLKWRCLLNRLPIQEYSRFPLSVPSLSGWTSALGNLNGIRANGMVNGGPSMDPCGIIGIGGNIDRIGCRALLKRRNAGFVRYNAGYSGIF